MAPICISKAEVEQGDCAHQLPSLGSMPEVPAPKTNVLKLARESFSGAFQKVLLCWALGWVSLPVGTLKSCASVCHIPALLVFEADALEAVSQVLIWKVGV